MALDDGTGVGGTETTRRMTGPGGAELNYQLFLDSARTTNWGNTTNNELTGNGNTNITVYGQIPSGQTAVPGTYTDTVSSDTTSFTVTAVILASCAITATAMNFGTYTAAVIHTTSTLTVTCTNTTPYNVGLNAGVGSGATVSIRKMTSPSKATLNYSIYRNSAWTQNWGNTVGSDTVPGTGNGNAQTITAYGQMAAGQFGNPAVYTDTITATVTY
jgi:spore coat protein U-like protein